MAKILIIDDDPPMCEMLTDFLVRMGNDVVSKATRNDGLQEALSTGYDIVFLDVRLPEGSGLDILSEIRETPSAPDVIIITGFGDADGAATAIKYGAWDYIQKKASPKTLQLPVQRIIEHRERLKKARHPVVALKLGRIIGNSSPIRACYDLLAQAAGSSANVLITGETGTGKELFSRAIHANSSRSGNAFVVIDCAALPATLVESTLFGHVKGAFTGADSDHEGLVKQADAGILFLDEIGELPLAVQKSFLRVLQEQRYRPVGGQNEIKSDFRIIAATNRDLDEMVTVGQFRKDLLYRIKALTIKLPPLRERSDDIIDIAMFYSKKICEQNQVGTKGFTPEFLEALRSYAWPGNVRELINTIETAVAAAVHDHILLPLHLPVELRIQLSQAPFLAPARSDAELKINEKISASLPAFRKLIESTEQRYFQDLISHTKGSIKASCEISGLSRSRMYGLLKKHNISHKT